MRSTPLPFTRVLLLAVVSLLLIPGEALAQSSKAPFDAPKGYDRAAEVQFDGAPADTRTLPEKLAALRGGLTEGFDDIAALPAAGWALQNNSEPLGATGWFQGNPGVFPAQAGADTSYVAANFQNGSGVATISNWLITPEVDLDNGTEMTFFARSADSTFPDRLQVRLSTSGASTDVGSGATDVGDFTELLLDINPNYEQGVFLNEWTEYTATVSGLSEPTTGRFAFRYFVENGGTSGSNSDFIGIDEVSITAVTTGPPTAGGPDAFGYTWVSSNDPEGPSYDFVDISGTGTNIGNSGDDASTEVTLPFSFSFYGDAKTTALVSSNGYLTFGTDGTDFSNDDIPDDLDPNDFVAPFWDDLETAAETADIFTQNMGDGRFIVQWNMVPRLADAGDVGNTFQVVLYEDGNVLYQYDMMNTPTLGSATVGLENSDATDGLRIAVNEEFVENALAVLINAPMDTGVMTIAEARAAGAGETVTVQGTVSRANGAFTYFQDETAGLTIRQTSGAFFDAVADGTIAEGTEIQVTGTLSAFNNLLQINGADLASYEILGQDGDITPQEVSVQELLDNGEDYEAEVVEVDDLTTDAMGTFEASTNYDVTDETATTTLRVPNASDSDVDGTMIPEGEFTFTGVVGQFSSDEPAAGYQLLAIAEGDIEPDAPAGALEFEPSPLVEMLNVGETGTETVTITNNTDMPVAFDFSQYSGEPDPATVAPAHGRYAGQALDLAKGEDDPRRGAGQSFGAGGPDGFGYRWIDSNEPGGPAFAWVDISATGTALTLGDDQGALVDLPFAFSFYGEDQTAVTIGSNGYLTFGDNGSDFSNDPIPSDAEPNNLIAPFWDDLDPGDGVGTVYYQDMGDGRFIVQYDGLPPFPGPGDGSDLYTFQVILNQSGSILYQYEEMIGEVTGATVGIENPDGTDGLEIALNEAYTEDGLAVLISVRPQFVTGVEPATGTVPGGGSVDVDVSFSAEGLLGGTYEGNLVVETDLAAEPSTFELPVVLEVTGAAECLLALDPASFGGTIVGTTSEVTATVTNGGTDSCSLTGATAGGPFSVDGFTATEVDPNASYSFIVLYSPTSVGEDTGTLTVEVADSDDLTAELTGTALGEPTPELSQESFSFEVEQNATTSGTFTISNVGGADAADLEYAITVLPAPTREGGVIARAAKAAGEGDARALGRLSQAADVARARKATGRAAGFGRSADVSAGPAPIREVPPGTVVLERGGDPSIAFGHDAATSAFVTFDFLDPATVTPISTIVPDAFFGAGALGDGADVAYQVDGGVLYSVDTETGAPTLVADLGVGDGLSGMTFDPTTDTFYGASTNITTSALYTIDVEAGSATLVGDMGTAGAIALAATPDGKLYTYDIVDDVFLEVNKDTGAATVIGSIGFDANFGQGMTYDYVNDVMTMAAFNNGSFQPELREVDLATGNTTLVGVLGVGQMGWVGAPAGAGFNLVQVSPESGTVAPDGSETITVTVDATDVEPGTYEADLVIVTNDPSNPTLTVPVTVTVSPVIPANEGDGVPTEFALGQNYPNPFASSTTIDYALPEAARVTITVYDAVGRRVAVLVDEDVTAGYHAAEWDTRGLASGVYLYRIEAGDYTKTRKMSIVR